MLERRLQVLVDDDLHKRLRTRAERSGASVGELVRRALEHEYPPEGEPLDRSEAARRILGWDPGPGREPDWSEQKRRMLDELSDVADA
jgi:plasmid stability protein